MKTFGLKAGRKRIFTKLAINCISSFEMKNFDCDDEMLTIQTIKGLSESDTQRTNGVKRRLSRQEPKKKARDQSKSNFDRTNQGRL